jgi:uncharacterized protein (DUF433 family)
MKAPVVCKDPEIMGGAPVFCGTRVPVQTLLDYLEAGDSIDEFLAGFPSVTRVQVVEFLEAAKDRLVETVGHDVKTARQMGWTAIRNGELLALASQEFDVFLTVDRNLSFQQNVPALTIAVIILHALTNRLADLQRLVPQSLAVIAAAQPGSLTVVGNP